MIYTEARACRACKNGNLSTVLDLGDIAVSDFLPAPDAPVDRAPLCLCRCDACGLVQLRHTVDRERLYRTYHYRSGVNETMRAALKDVVQEALANVTFHPDDAVLDVGSNDFTLLSFMPKYVKRIGYDPSDVAREAWFDHQDCDLVRSFFPNPLTHEVRSCKVVTAVAMLYDVEDPVAFFREVHRWLHPEGVFVCQYQGLEDMLACDGVDNICHEHLLALDLHSVRRMLREAGLRIDSWRRVAINGGSTRLICRRQDAPANWQSTAVPPPRVSTVDLWDFVARVTSARDVFLDYLRDCHAVGKRVYGAGASTKWNTFADWAGIGDDLIRAIGDRTPQKHGTYTTTGIPVISEEEMRAADPDVVVVAAWQFWDAIVARERSAGLANTTFVSALPTLRIDSPQRVRALVD